MSKTILTNVDGWTPLIDEITNQYGVVTSAVFGRVWRYCQMEDGVCCASQETIANDLRMDRATVNTHIKILVRDGYLQDLDPNVKNRPHRYADTGKAGLESSIVAKKSVVKNDPPPQKGVVLDNTSPQKGVNFNDTSPENLPVGVVKNDTGVVQNDTRCQFRQHLGVVKNDMNKTLLRDSLRDESGNEKNLSIHSAWQMVLIQLRAEMHQSDFATYVNHLRPIAIEEDFFQIGAINALTRDWCSSRLGTRIRYLLESIYQHPLQLQWFVVEPSR